MIPRSTVVVAALLACGGHGSPPPEPSQPGPVGHPPRPAQRVDYAGISFDLDPAIATEVVTAQVAACPLDNPTDKPDGVAPAHIAFRFGPRGDDRNCSVPDLSRPGLY